jgi:hypothetical protein
MGVTLLLSFSTMKKLYTYCLGLLCGLLLPLSSQAQFDSNKVYAIINYGNNQAIEVGGDNRSAVNHTLNLWGYWGGAHQQWRIYPNANGTYTFQNRNSGLIMTRRTYSDYKIPLVQINGNGSVYQQWSINDLGGGLWEIAVPDGYNSVLTSGTSAVGVDPNLIVGTRPPATAPAGTNFNPKYLLIHKWYIQDVSANPTGQYTQSVFQIVNRYTGKVLGSTEDSNGNQDSGANQQTYTGLSGQQWTFTDYDASGYLSIINRFTQQVLQIGTGDQRSNGNEANVADRSGGQNQQWYLQDVNSNKISVAQATDGRFFQIVNRYSGKVLEVRDGSFVERMSAQQWDNAGVLWQYWYVRYTSANRTAASLPATASEQVADHMVSLFPNPAQNELTVSLPMAAKLAWIQVADVRGSATSARYLGNGKIDISNLASGVYVITLSDGQSEYHQKFVKQ